MKRLLLIILISNGIQAMSTNSDFVRRFGSNSTIYNTMLYFDDEHCAANEKNKKPAPRKYKKPVRKKNNNTAKQIPASYRRKSARECRLD